MALFVSSHYKNSPNDLQLLSDAPAHLVFVLLPPVATEQSSLPDVLCVLQVCLEGAISRDNVMKSLSRGKRASGDLIPWTVSQQVSGGCGCVWVCLPIHISHCVPRSLLITVLGRYLVQGLFVLLLILICKGCVHVCVWVGGSAYLCYCYSSSDGVRVASSSTITELLSW